MLKGRSSWQWPRTVQYCGVVLQQAHSCAAHAKALAAGRMSQLSIKLDNLLQEAKRAVQRSPKAKQRHTQDRPRGGEDLITATRFGLFSGSLVTAKHGSSEEDLAVLNESGILATSSSNTTDEQQQSGGDLAQQLAAAKEQCSLKQQEVEVLQAQVQRLCAFVESAVANEAEADAGVSACVDSPTNITACLTYHAVRLIACLHTTETSSTSRVWLMYMCSQQPGHPCLTSRAN